MSVQSVSKSAKRPSKPVVTKKATAKKVKESSPSPSRALVQLAVRNLSIDGDAFVAKAKSKGIKADESRVRSIFARCKFILAAAKEARS